ncbi:cytokinin riboside 5'-monophosphate phosphoribohydrolase [Marmoricola endophyticus]|uniref:Cytokinin riboside 5'-monophosphate phosphoribohydrolase n=1 Tax=Marmoricola endophyticus TaxID=2040280 RepID=A0A917F378_9ACTN|nr:TIGR00730 family Rossman fold protein [Marmoricola endophyticus]GGF40562.1 cytokinin riboside 5'-monophosphate phosphoribohydrolase [Marmoricola endophyticus]
MKGTSQRICVYLGSSPGNDPAYVAAAEHLAARLAARGLGLVYGGASVGTMGTLADAALAAGAEVVGVIPQSLQDKEVGHTGLTELAVVGSMHERKLEMMDRSDAFVVLPGGSGTLEELFETFTWLQLGIHDKPIGLLDVAGYWAPLVAFLDHAVAAGFLSRDHADMLLVDEDADRLLDRFEDWEPPRTSKWADRTEA